MSTLDIRSNQSDDITTLLFSDAGYGYASRVTRHGSYLTLADIDGDDQADVKDDDISSLILALQKARELGWGN